MDLLYDFRRHPQYRWLALGLSVALCLPAPAWALRIAQPVDTGLEARLKQVLQGGLETTDAQLPMDPGLLRNLRAALRPDSNPLGDPDLIPRLADRQRGLPALSPEDQRDFLNRLSWFADWEVTQAVIFRLFVEQTASPATLRLRTMLFDAVRTDPTDRSVHALVDLVLAIPLADVDQNFILQFTDYYRRLSPGDRVTASPALMLIGARTSENNIIPYLGTSLVMTQRSEVYESWAVLANNLREMYAKGTPPAAPVDSVETQQLFVEFIRSARQMIEGSIPEVPIDTQFDTLSNQLSRYFHPSYSLYVRLRAAQQFARLQAAYNHIGVEQTVHYMPVESVLYRIEVLRQIARESLGIERPTDLLDPSDVDGAWLGVLRDAFGILAVYLDQPTSTDKPAVGVQFKDELTQAIDQTGRLNVEAIAADVGTGQTRAVVDAILERVWFYLGYDVTPAVLKRTDFRLIASAYSALLQFSQRQETGGVLEAETAIVDLTTVSAGHQAPMNRSAAVSYARRLLTIVQKESQLAQGGLEATSSSDELAQPIRIALSVPITEPAEVLRRPDIQFELAEQLAQGLRSALIENPISALVITEGVDGTMALDFESLSDDRVTGRDAQLELLHVIDNAVGVIAARSAAQADWNEGSIEVVLRREGSGLVLEVSDDGIGFKKEFLRDRAFRSVPIETDVETLRSGGIGTALLADYGLGIVRANNWILQVDSRRMGAEDGAWQLTYEPEAQEPYRFESTDRSEIGSTVRWIVPGFFSNSGLEEATLAPVSAVDVVPGTAPVWVTSVRKAAQVQDRVAVLFAPELLGATADDLDLRVDLMGIEGGVHGAFHWSDQTALRLDLLTDTSVAEYAAQGYWVIQAVRDPGSSDQAPLGRAAIPLVAARAIAHALDTGQNRFAVDTALFRADVQSLSFPEVLAGLEAQFSA